MQMQIKYFPGFVVIENGKGPVFVAVHSTQTYQKAKRGDIGTETVALAGVKKIGGSAIISTIPREDIGLDLNRLPPVSCELSMKMYKHWQRNDNDFAKYYKTYAWVCQSKNEFNKKMSLYREFWKAVEKHGKLYKKPFFVFCHTLSARLKNLPSAVDIISKSGEWMDKSLLIEAINKINKKHSKSRENQIYQRDLKEEMLFWLKLNEHYINEVFGGMRKVKGIAKEWLEEDLKNANNILGTRYSFRQLNSKLYRHLINRTIKKIKMKITYENIYNGATAHPVTPLVRRTNGQAVEIEAMSHLNEMHPESVVKIIEDIINTAK